jgi:hypothetical protein
MIKTFSSREIILPHQQMLEMRKAGILSLGINHELASQISESGLYSPKKTTAQAAYRFWTLVGVAGFLYTIYLSFTEHWWWFLIGFVAMGVLGKANMKGNSENLLDAATIDSDFYERVRTLGGWLYQLEEAEAEKYRV